MLTMDLPCVGDEQIRAFEVAVYYLFAVHVSHLRREKPETGNKIPAGVRITLAACRKTRRTK